MKSNPQLTIVMPAYNEADCIEIVAKKWLKLLSDWQSQTHSSSRAKLLVVNDGSKDDTGKILDSLAVNNSQLTVIHKKNGGHGAAVLTGYREALAMGSDYIFQTDSDDQFDPEDFWSLWKMREASPLVLGHRRSRSDAIHRIWIAKIVFFLNFLLFGVWLKDANIPYRLIESSFLRSALEMFPADVFAPNIFLSVIGKKIGSDLQETPIRHMERQTGQVSIVRLSLLKSCIRSAKELFLFRISLLVQREELKALRVGNV